MSRRTRIVWAAFAASMTFGAGLLMLGHAESPRRGGAEMLMAAGNGSSGGRGVFLAAAPASFAHDDAVIDGRAQSALRADDPILPRDAALDRARWQGIVIHHSGAPAGDPESISRQHVAAGLAGLGYHFVIGNGHGLGDGVVVVGPRWSRQLPGAHAGGPRGEWLNEHAIGICLVGNGERHPFTERQIRELIALVRRLQDALGISADAVQLHSDVAPVVSPGRLFPASELEAQLRR